jgi:putative intracellular protease/amidase
MSNVIFPLPSKDFDPSEIAVSWLVLTKLGHHVSFATPDGLPAQCDPIMISGRGLDPWSWVPLLGSFRLLGLILRADSNARRAFKEMTQDRAFQNPLRWLDVKSNEFDGMLLGGGHRARGMRQYLESDVLQKLVTEFFHAEKPVAAVCHGVLLAARSKYASGRSVLYGLKTTSLTWKQERTASALSQIGRFWDRNYYRTYPEEPGQPKGYMSVEQEVIRALQKPEDFLDVPADAPHRIRKTSGISRDSWTDDRAAWVVQDKNYVSARWPGDAHTFAKRFSQVLDQRAGSTANGD